MRQSHRGIPVFLSVALVLAPTACRDTPSGPSGPVERVVLEASTANVPVGGTLEIRAVLTDAEGRGLAGRAVEWESSDLAVATVSEDGVARGIGPGMTTITARSEGVSTSAELSVAPAHEGGVTSLESVPGGPVHLFSPSFGGVHMEISTLTILGDTIPGVALRYTETGGKALLTVAPDEPGLLPDLMWASPHVFGRQIRSPVPGFRPPGADERDEGVTPLQVRVFPRPATVDSEYATMGYQDLLTFQWQLEASGGPCRGVDALADSIRAILAAAESEGRGRRVVLRVGQDLEPGRVAGGARLLNPAMAREGHELYLDAARMAELAGFNGGLGTGDRALIWTEELTGDRTGGEPWTLTAVDSGDDYCNGLFASALELLREEPLAGPPGGAGRLIFRVINDFGEGVAGVPVGFEVTEGGGTVLFETGTSNGAGEVLNEWVLGPQETRQTLVVRVLDENGDPRSDIEGSPMTLSFVAREGPPWSDLSVSCGLRDQGELWCWEQSRAALLADDPVFREITSVFGGDGCAVDVDGAGWCWGFNFYGQLGNGTTAGSELPVRVSGGLELVDLDRGSDHTCGVTPEGQAWCWGRNNAGQLGDGTEDGSLVPVPVEGDLVFESVSAGFVHSCGVAVDERAYCWGAPGALGIGADTASWEPGPLAVTGGLAFAAVDAGESHTCGITPEGDAYCWGWERDGALGNGAASDEIRLEPVPVVGGLRFDAVGVGDLFACGLTPEGRAFCWGRGSGGRLGNGSSEDRTEPAPVSGDHVFVELGVGSGGACGIDSQGRAWCWGRTATSGESLVPARLGERW